MITQESHIFGLVGQYQLQNWLATWLRNKMEFSCHVSWGFYTCSPLGGHVRWPKKARKNTLVYWVKTQSSHIRKCLAARDPLRFPRLKLIPLFTCVEVYSANRDMTNKGHNKSPSYKHIVVLVVFSYTYSRRVSYFKEKKVGLSAKGNLHL